MTDSIKTIFEETLKGVNPITPKILSYEQCGNYFVEVSEGTGFNREPIYGVTVLEATDPYKHRPDLGKCYTSMKEVESRLNYLKTLA